MDEPWAGFLGRSMSEVDENHTVIGERVRTANGTAMYTVWAAYTMLWLLCSALFFLRKHIHPIRARSPGLVLISAIAGELILTNLTFAHFFTGIEGWPCPFSLWILWIAYPSFFLPFPIRAIRLFVVFMDSKAKVDVQSDERNHLGLIQSIQSMDTNVDIELKEVPTPPTKESESDDSENQSNPMFRKGRSSIGNPKPGSFADASLDPSELSSNRPTRGGSVARVGRSIQLFQMNMPKRTWFERHLEWLLGVLIFLCIVTATVRQNIESLGNGPECTGCMTTKDGAQLQSGLFLLVIILQLTSVIFLSRRSVRDEFNIGQELAAVTISWCVLVGPTLVISVLASSCEAQRLTKNSCSYTETLSDDCYFLFVLQHWLMAATILSNFSITIVAPLWATLLHGAQKLTLDKPKLRFPDIGALRSLGTVLDDDEASRAFQSCLVSEFSVENILFFRQAEVLESCTTLGEARSRAMHIYQRYIAESGSCVVNIPSGTRRELRELIIDRGELVTMDLVRLTHVFEEAKTEIFRLMETDSFPRFLRSDICKRLVMTWKERAAKTVTLHNTGFL